MDMSADDHRQAYSHWLRTGRWPVAPSQDGVELKFNPYHDPQNGRFTFAPGGPHSLNQVVISHRRRETPPVAPAARSAAQGPTIQPADKPILSDAIYLPDSGSVTLFPASFPRIPRIPRNSNIRAFQDPMTLQQVFPGLQNSPGGSIIALADTILDITGPTQELTAELTRDWSNTLINQIKTVDPSYRLASLGFPETLTGQINQINQLRFDQAAAFFRVKNELRPMQVETLRLMQQSADQAYEKGIRLLRAGKLKVRLSEREALGNFIDREVRDDLRRRYGQYGIDASGKGSIRVNRREDNTSGNELTFRRPDARVGNIAYDVTLTQKTLKTPQIRDFFQTDFKPTHTIIIRPRQIGLEYTYIITRPETKP